MPNKTATIMSVMPGRIDVDFGFQLHERKRDAKFNKDMAISGTLKFEPGDSPEMAYIVRESLNDHLGINEFVVSQNYMRIAFSKAQIPRSVVAFLIDVIEAAGVELIPN
jgi:hypothetical protein